MMRFFGWLGSVFRALFGWIGLFRQQAQQAQTAGARVKNAGGGLRLALHVLLVLAVLILLFLLNLRSEGIQRTIPYGPVLRSTWLPILGLLLYALGWLIWLLVKLLREDEGWTAFPDIDAAWEEAMAALAQANVRLTDLPLFLVLGQPESDERHLFQAAQLELAISQTPARPNAPLHVYVTRRPEAIFVTCPGASLLGLHAAVLAGKERLAEGGEDYAPAIDDFAPGRTHDPTDISATMVPGQAGEPVAGIRDIRARADRERRDLTDWEKRQIGMLFRRDNPLNSLPRHPERMAEQAERLRHLCRLIVRDRHPFCPVNGILLLIPLAGTDHEQDAADTSTACRQDLEAARSVLKVHCPLFVLVCDFEVVPGFAEFIDRFNAKDRKRRVGHGCPLVPDFRRAAPAANGRDPVEHMLDSLSGWICNTAVPAFVYTKFNLERDGDPENVATTVQHNSQLYLFANELRERQDRLSRILTQGLAAAAGEPPLIAGCYIAGTGADPQRQQAFVAGVLQKMVDEQERVFWSEEALAEERRLETLTTAGWVATGACALLVLVLLVRLVQYVSTR